MQQPIDRTRTEACAKRTLGLIVRTGLLLAGAVLAGVLAVELPAAAPAGQPYVPASDRWIELGGEEAPDPEDSISLPRRGV